MTGTAQRQNGAIAIVNIYVVICHSLAGGGCAGQLFLEGAHRIVHQHGDSHWADAAGHRCDGGRDRACLLKVNIADEAVPASGGRICIRK